MLSAVLTWLVIAIVINIGVRHFLKTTPRKMVYNAVFSSPTTSDYVKGYLAGITNVKMYYYVIGDIPTVNWLDANKFHLLNNREDLLKTVDEASRRGAGILHD